MFDQKEEFDENIKSLDYVIRELEKVLNDEGVLDYDPVNMAQDPQLLEDKKFRAVQ